MFCRITVLKGIKPAGVCTEQSEEMHCGKIEACRVTSGLRSDVFYSIVIDRYFLW